MNRQLPVRIVDSQKKGKKMKTMVKLIAVLAMLCMGIGEVFAYDSSYPSLFTLSKRNLFCSDQAQINGLAGAPNVGGCVDPYRFSYAEDRAGFSVRNDPTDARIVCGIDYTHGVTHSHGTVDFCITKPKSLRFTGSINQDIRNFRIYVPKGTISMGVHFLIPGMLQMAAAVQFGSPPTQGLSSDYYSMNFAALKLKDTSQSAQMVRSTDGEITLIQDSGISSDNNFLLNLPWQDRWLYVKVFDFSGSGYVQVVTYTITVDYEQYLEWYNTMQPDDWKILGEEGSGPFIVPPDTQSSSGAGSGISVPITESTFGGGTGSSSLPSSGSSTSASGTPIITSGMTLADILSASLRPPSTTPTVPVFNQAIQVQKAADITVPKSITWSQSSVDLKPALNIVSSLLNTQVKVYAAYINPDKKIYVANSNSVFQLYQGGDIPVYLTTTIRSDVWPMSSEGINPFSSLAGTVAQGRSYIFGVTPSDVSSSPQQFIDNFWGTWFQLTPPTSTSTSTQCGTVFGCGT